MVRPKPACPKHPGSKVRFDGSYGRGPRRRQRYECLPGNGEHHVFTEPLPRTLAHEGEECWECERSLAPHEGPPAPRLFEYTVREVAEALVLVGRGMTYSGAAREIGPRAKRRKDCKRPRRQDGRTVAAWVELFAPTIFEALRPRAWPPVVVLDSQPFAVRGNLDERGHSRRGGRPAFHVFAAMGYEGFDKPVKLVGLRSFPGFAFRHGTGYWAGFLRSLDAQLDGAPRQIVCDADPEIRAAIDEVWPPGSEGAPEVWLCHYHMRARFQEMLRKRKVAVTDPLWLAAGEAFDGAEAWARFEHAVAEHQPREDVRLVARWLRGSLGARARYQVAHRVGHVTDTTAVEQYLAWLKSQLGLRRASLRNRGRLDCLLMLMMLQQRAPASRNVYAHAIREQLLAHGGRALTRRELAKQKGRGSLRLPPPAPRRERATPTRTPEAIPYPPDPQGEDVPF